MSKKETKLYRDIMVAASKLGARLFRNNVGAAWQGKSDHVGRELRILDPRRVKYGLCKGSSDAIGWTPVKIKQEHVGKTVAIFTAIETKGTKRKATKEQINFVEQVNTVGGIGVIAYTVKDALDAIQEVLK